MEPRLNSSWMVFERVLSIGEDYRSAARTWVNQRKEVASDVFTNFGFACPRFNTPQTRGVGPASASSGIASHDPITTYVLVDRVSA